MNARIGNRLEIHFYGEPNRNVVLGQDSPDRKRSDVAVVLEMASADEAEKRDNQIFLFAWYVLYQLWKLGQNRATHGMCGLLSILTSDSERQKFVSGNSYYSAESLLNSAANLSNGSVSVMNDGVLRDAFFGYFPTLINYSGREGDIIYSVVDYPKFAYREKGFGILRFVLGAGANYYGCHSVLALMRLLLGRSGSDSFNDALSDVGKVCASLHLQKKIALGKIPQLCTMVYEAVTDKHKL